MPTFIIKHMFEVFHPLSCTGKWLVFWLFYSSLSQLYKTSNYQYLKPKMITVCFQWQTILKFPILSNIWANEQLSYSYAYLCQMLKIISEMYKTSIKEHLNQILAKSAIEHFSSHMDGHLPSRQWNARLHVNTVIKERLLL